MTRGGVNFFQPLPGACKLTNDKETRYVHHRTHHQDG
jgi:hypothetical protein